MLFRSRRDWPFLRGKRLLPAHLSSKRRRHRVEPGVRRPGGRSMRPVTEIRFRPSAQHMPTAIEFIPVSLEAIPGKTVPCLLLLIRAQIVKSVIAGGLCHRALPTDTPGHSAGRRCKNQAHCSAGSVPAAACASSAQLAAFCACAAALKIARLSWRNSVNHESR